MPKLLKYFCQAIAKLAFPLKALSGTSQVPHTFFLPPPLGFDQVLVAMCSWTAHLFFHGSCSLLTHLDVSAPQPAGLSCLSKRRISVSNPDSHTFGYLTPTVFLGTQRSGVCETRRFHPLMEWESHLCWHIHSSAASQTLTGVPLADLTFFVI